MGERRIILVPIRSKMKMVKVHPPHAAIADWFWSQRDPAASLANYDEALHICRASETGTSTMLVCHLLCFKAAALLLTVAR